MAIGRLYLADSKGKQLVGYVNYRLQSESSTGWWGELVFIDYKAIKDGSGYIIELDDGRKGMCNLKKRVNRAVSGVPPRYIYHFSGTKFLKK
ncbi:hypothetical protein ACFLXF_02385 [Chloroflexota bacterium]